MTPLSTLLANYNFESAKTWNQKCASSDLKSLKEEIFIKAGKKLIFHTQV